MVKARSLSQATSDKLNEVFQEPPAGAKPPEVLKPMTFEELKGTFRKDAVYEIPVSWFDLEDKIFATRTEITEEEIQSMADAIGAQGQHEPIKARVDQAKDKLQIVMGWTRTLGCLRLGRTVQTLLTDAEVKACKAWAFAENMVRNELNGWDQARKMRELLEEGFSVEEVAMISGNVSKGHVYAVKTIFKFPKISEALKSNRIKFSDAIHLANRTSSKEITEDLQVKAIDGFAGGTLKRTDLDYFLDKKGDVPAAAAPAAPPPQPGKKTGGKGKGSNKNEKRKTPREGTEAYFQRFTDGKILFSAKAVPGKTDVKELKRIQAAAVQFVKALSSMIKKAK